MAWRRRRQRPAGFSLPAGGLLAVAMATATTGQVGMRCSALHGSQGCRQDQQCLDIDKVEPQCSPLAVTGV